MKIFSLLLLLPFALAVLRPKQMSFKGDIVISGLGGNDRYFVSVKKNDKRVFKFKYSGCSCRDCVASFLKSQSRNSRNSPQINDKYKLYNEILQTFLQDKSGSCKPQVKPKAQEKQRKPKKIPDLSLEPVLMVDEKNSEQDKPIEDVVEEEILETEVKSEIDVPIDGEEPTEEEDFVESFEEDSSEQSETVDLVQKEVKEQIDEEYPSESDESESQMETLAEQVEIIPVDSLNLSEDNLSNISSVDESKDEVQELIDEFEYIEDDLSEKKRKGYLNGAFSVVKKVYGQVIGYGTE